MGSFLKNFKTHKKFNLFKCPKFYRTNCDLMVLVFLQIFLLLVTVINCSEFNLISGKLSDSFDNKVVNKSISEVNNNNNSKRLIVFSDNRDGVDNFSESARLSNFNDKVKAVETNETATPEQPSLEEDEEDMDEVKLQQIIMQGLGLKSLPDVTKMNISQKEYTTKYNEYLSRVLERKKREMLEHNSVEYQEDILDPVRLYSVAHNASLTELYKQFSGRRRRRSTGSNHDIVFVRFPIDFENSDVPADIQEATLRLLLVARKRHHHQHHSKSVTTAANAGKSIVVNLKVYQLIEPYGRVWLDTRKIEFDGDEEPSSSRWVEFDVTKATVNWLVGKQSNLGLELLCDGCHDFGVHVMDDTSLNSDPDSSPMLNIIGRLGAHREKRSRTHHNFMQAARRKPRKTDCVQENNKCCRHKMEVVFSEIKGYDFIIQPKTFDAGYCRGKCPPRYNPAHQHAFFQSLIWKQDKNKAPRPCCAPSKLAELEVLHVDEKNRTRLKVSTWKDMRVQECACS